MGIAVLGAAGRLGRRVVAALLDGGCAPADVVALARRPERLADLAVAARPADWDDEAGLRAAFDGVERALLVPTLAPPVLRVRQYENAVAAARAAGVHHLVHCGLVGTSVEARFRVMPFLLYAESLLRTCGLDWTILRNSLYADPVADWVPRIVAMGTIPYPTGDGRCAWVTRDDLARAAAAVLAGDGHAGRTYELTGPRALSTSDLCRIVARVTGERVTDFPATDEDYLAACRAEKVPDEEARGLLSIYHDVRAGRFDVATRDVLTLTGAPAEEFEDYLRRRLA